METCGGGSQQTSHRHFQSGHTALNMFVFHSPPPPPSRCPQVFSPVCYTHLTCSQCPNQLTCFHSPPSSCELLVMLSLFLQLSVPALFGLSCSVTPCSDLSAGFGLWLFSGSACWSTCSPAALSVKHCKTVCVWSR